MIAPGKRQPILKAVPLHRPHRTRLSGPRPTIDVRWRDSPSEFVGRLGPQAATWHDCGAPGLGSTVVGSRSERGARSYKVVSPGVPWPAAHPTLGVGRPALPAMHGAMGLAVRIPRRTAVRRLFQRAAQAFQPTPVRLIGIPPGADRLFRTRVTPGIRGAPSSSATARCSSCV